MAEASYIGCDTLYQLLAEAGTYDGGRLSYANDLLGILADRLSVQAPYTVAPWFLGIIAGEIVVRYRKPSGGERQEV